MVKIHQHQVVRRVKPCRGWLHRMSSSALSCVLLQLQPCCGLVHSTIVHPIIYRQIRWMAPSGALKRVDLESQCGERGRPRPCPFGDRVTPNSIGAGGSATSSYLVPWYDRGSVGTAANRQSDLQSASWPTRRWPIFEGEGKLQDGRFFRRYSGSVLVLG